MGSYLNALAQPDGTDVIHSEEYITFMGSHLNFLRNNPSTAQMQLDPIYVHKNLNDYPGLFMDMGIRYEDHLLMMMVNDIQDPLTLTEDVTTLLVPDSSLVDRLKMMFQTTLV